ncbi:MAG TPA: DUF1015 domain-containing protein [Candidatus Binatia bacterium]|nr:DUF1015 domain-containing protein [Candidatus Binatia bacterium]
MPILRPFRALRYDRDAVGDLAAVVSPPYDVISPDEQRRLLERHPRNVVRLDLPPEEPGDAPDDRYRRAARTFAEWRSDGTLRKDPRPAIYAYEQRYRPPGQHEERTVRGFFARLRLEPFGPGSGVLPHERTLSGPKEDRYRLLRATGANFSPIVGLFEEPSGRAAALLADLGSTPPDLEVRDDNGVLHRLWIVPVQAETGAAASKEPSADRATELLSLAGANPITIADGHHRYETALRYRDERRMTRTCEEDPAFDYVLALLLDAHHSPPMVLPTHRVVVGLGEDGVERLLAGLGEFFVVTAVEPSELVERFGGGGSGPGGAGRFGLLTRRGSALLESRRDAFEPLLPRGGDALRRLDVVLLGVVLEGLCGLDPATVAAGGRLVYTKSAAEAAELVRSGSGGADVAFLLEPTPVADIVAVARDGDVMPQKSTYFYPKPLTGLVLNPLEW